MNDLPIGISPNARWIFGTRPIWQAVGFGDYFFDPLQDPKPLQRGLLPGAFLPAVELLQHVLSHMAGSHGEWFLSLAAHEMANISLVIPVLSELKALTNTANRPTTLEARTAIGSWVNSRSESAVYDACALIVHRLTTMAVGGYVLVPGGWFHKSSTRAGEEDQAIPVPADSSSLSPDYVPPSPVASPTTSHVDSTPTDPCLKPSGAAAMGHNVLYCVQRLPGGYSFTVINTNVGEGLKYHPFSLEASPHIRYRFSFLVDNIAPGRILETGFWLALLRMQAFPSATSRAEHLYEVLLPYLADKPLVAIQSDNNDDAKTRSWATEWKVVPSSGDASLIHALIEACHFMMRRRGMDPSKVALVDVLTQWQLVHMVYEDMAHLTALCGSEARVFQMICQRLASSVAVHVQKYQPRPEHAEEITAKVNGLSQPYVQNQGLVSTAILKAVQSFIEQIHARMQSLPRYTIMRNVQPPLLTTSSEGWSTPFTPLPLFGRMRCDESVEGLAGPAALPPIFRPIEFTLVKERATTLDDVSLTLRHCDHICTLLSHQRSTIKNVYPLTAAFIQHVMTQVIPTPLPRDHPERANCVWSQSMKYERQIDLLRMLRLLCRHFTAACMSLRVTRSFDASRILTMAAMASMADVLLRVRASDVPSLFSLHYNGTAPHTPRFFQQPYGIGWDYFIKQSEYMKFTTPELTVCRTRVLDYFHSQSQLIKPDHLLFQFELSHKPGNVTRLLEQVCWEIGFPAEHPNDLPKYLTAEKRELTLNYPELVYFRDIVYTFKFLNSSTGSNLPEIRCWSQSDADLSWTYNADTGEYEVRAFGGKVLQCAQPRMEEYSYELQLKKQKEDREAGLLSKLFGFNKDTRAGPSAADPTALTGYSIYDEEDVLHLENKQLPSFDGKLSPSSSELLVSYLTAPYLRIPLILHFFASPEHIHALGVRQLQMVVDGALFEPQLWQTPDMERQIPDQVPLQGTSDQDRSIFATPCGLLFNELQKSPIGILRALTDMLELIIELDTGRYNPSSASLILYVIRLIVRVEGFMLFLTHHHRWLTDFKPATTNGTAPLVDMNGRIEGTVNGTGWDSLIRGLQCSPGQVEMLTEKRNQLRLMLNEQIYPMLTRWAYMALREDNVTVACQLHAHLCFLFQHIPDDEFTPSIVTTHLCAQLFLTTRYRYDISAENGATSVGRMAQEREPDSGLGINDMEIFDLFQKQRPRMMSWLDAHPEHASPIMETIVKVVTMTSLTPDEALPNAVRNFTTGFARMQATKAEEEKRKAAQESVATILRGGVPPAAANPSTPSKSPSGAAAVSKVDLTVPVGVAPPPKSVALSDSDPESEATRYWRSMDGMHCVGRMIPDSYPRTEDEQDAREAERMYIRGESKVETEINLQLGSLTLNTSRLESLDRSMSSQADFQDVFGAGSDQMSAAPVKLTTRRTWVRLVGTRHDLQLWDPDERCPRLFPYVRRLAQETLNSSERWIWDVLSKAVRFNNILKSVELFLPEKPYTSDNNWATLGGYQIDRPHSSARVIILGQTPPQWEQKPVRQQTH